jgi:hypothetical protein
MYLIIKMALWINSESYTEQHISLSSHLKPRRAVHFRLRECIESLNLSTTQEFRFKV